MLSRVCHVSDVWSQRGNQTVDYETVIFQIEKHTFSTVYLDEGIKYDSPLTFWPYSFFTAFIKIEQKSAA